jgi:pimeloyl-ACP methyl ester carboxylesterase
MRMEIPGHGEAVIVTPAAGGKMPLTVVLHGSWDRPEWMCDVFSRVSRGRSWVVCLRGTLRPEMPEDGPRWTFGKPVKTLTEINAAIRTIRLHYGDRIAPGPPILAGFSKGAYQAAWLASRHPDRFPKLLLTEGGHSSMSRKAVKRFAKRGGKAVAWGCGTASCEKASKRACSRLRRAGVECELQTDLRYGHSYNPPFSESGRKLFGWVLSR